MLLPDAIKATLERIKDIAKTETVFGDPIEIGNVTLVPVSRVNIGFAAGGGAKDEKNGAGASGGGVNISPVAIISISKINCEVGVHLLNSGESDLEKLLTLAPDAVNQIYDLFKKKPKGGKANSKNNKSDNSDMESVGKDSE